VGRTNGGMIVHLGVLMIGVALAASNSYSVERDARLCLEAAPGCPATVTVRGHEITFLGSTSDVTAARREVGAKLDVDGKVFEPAIQQFVNGTQQIGKPSVRNTARDSVLLTLTDLPSADDSVSVKIIVQPLIVWLWIGGGVMAIGSLMAIFPGKRRVPTAPVSL
jgi:cytochrome c-type biogenesis protein CcmF